MENKVRFRILWSQDKLEANNFLTNLADALLVSVYIKLTATERERVRDREISTIFFVKFMLLRSKWTYLFREDCDIRAD